MAVYTLLDLEKQVIPVYAWKYDIRVLLMAAKTLYSGQPIPGETIIRKLLKIRHSKIYSNIKTGPPWSTRSMIQRTTC